MSPEERFAFHADGGVYCEMCHEVVDAPVVTFDFYNLCVPCIVAAHNAIPEKYRKSSAQTEAAPAAVTISDDTPTVEPIRAPKKREEDADEKPRPKKKTARRKSKR